ncbi:DUF3987 domain-containing protein [Chroococcus sp. FPU101]|uniref:DUF3987 domain-containing protein n=1 Tax=Chroococcus sp. FPU101 TaxID=1974212 RepID=UPI001A8F740B|nr:DUF3987 domain-containing protein [Chroococcus sp. FPU101]GFE70048.1 hypothetical protein CFPU101_26580 [Chroococcus sp. FPU101]
MNNSILQQLTNLPQSWRFTPVNSKKQPIVSKWQETPLTTQDIIDKYQFNNNVKAVGILTGELSGGVVAVDHDGESCDPLIEELSGLSLAQALPKTVGFTSGKTGRYQLLYQIPELFWPYIDNKKIDTKVKDLNGKDEQLDFRWNGHQSVIIGVHPEKRSYSWLPNQSPSDIEVADCPHWIIREMLSFSRNTPTNNREKTIACLDVIKNKDLGWYGWRDVLLALHYEGVDQEIAYIWSSCSEKHTDKGFDDVWEHIRDNKPDGKNLTLGTLIHEAQKIDPYFKPNWNGISQNATPKQKDDGLEEIKDDLTPLLSSENRCDVHLLKDEILNPIRAISKRYNKPPQSLEMSILTASAGQLPTRTRLRIDDHETIPPVLWTVLSGVTGCGKSPIIDTAISALKDLQTEAAIEYQNEKDQYDLDLKAYKKAEKDKEADVFEIPKPPIFKDIFINDTTIEALARSISSNPQNGSLITIDEFVSFMGSFEAYKKAGSDRGKWLTLYNAGCLKINRASLENPIFIPDTSVSLLSSVQPETLSHLIKKDNNPFDGLWSRFSFVRVPWSRKNKDSASYDMKPLLKDLYSRCRSSLARELRLSSIAKKRWDLWSDEIDDLMFDSTNSMICGLYPKYRDRAARLALIAHEVNDITSDFVEVDELERAINYTRFLLNEALQVYGSIGLTLDEVPNQILNFVKRFSDQGWLTTKRVRQWISAKEKPSYQKTRTFMAQVVQLGYAENNGKSVDSSDYQIRIISKNVVTVVTNDPKPNDGKGLNSDYNLVTFSHSVVTDNNKNGHSENGTNGKSIVLASDYSLVTNDQSIVTGSHSSVTNGKSIVSASDYSLVTLENNENTLDELKSSDYRVTKSDYSLVTNQTHTHQDLQSMSDYNDYDLEKNEITIYVSPQTNRSNEAFVNEKTSNLESHPDITSKKNEGLLAKIENKNLEYDVLPENKSENATLRRLDIYKLDTTPIPDWKPKKTLKPYKDLSITYLDIETTGLDSKKERVIFIGCKQNGQYQTFTNPSEAQILTDFSNWFNQSGSDVLVTFNGYKFDIPFLIERFKVNGLQNACPFQQASPDDKWGKKIVDKAQENGKPFEFLNVTCKNRSISIIDNYLLVLLWDYVAMKLTSHTLKQSVLQMGLREEQRLELSHNQIMDAWNNGDSDRLVEYLKYDLDDTELLTNKLLPSYYYQLALLDGVSLQGVTIMGQAGKWSIILGQHYGKSYKNSLTADEPIKFEGGSVLVNAGLYKNAAKIDVASLYPSIMLNYGITSRKDKDRFQLQVLKYLTSERLQLKALGKQGDTEAHHFSDAMKVLINSGYGFLGTSKIPFNDYESASKVTAMGREILAVMLSKMKELGAVVIEADTDGVIFSSDDPRAIYEAVQSVLPDGINIELEWSNYRVYVPKAKSYLIFGEDGKATAKGLFRKRDQNWINKGFVVEYLKHYLESPEQSQDYFLKIFDEIRERKIDIEKLQVTKRIPKNNKSLAHLGSLGDKVTYWIAEQSKYHKTTGQKLKSALIPTTEQPYFIDYYLGELEDVRLEINKVIEQTLLT